MASLESKLFTFLLRLINKKKFLEMQFAFRKFNFYECPEPSKEVFKVCHVEKRQAVGQNVFVLTPKNAPPGIDILYLHGGAYVQNFVKQHWKFLSTLVAGTACTIVAPDYPLAPAFPYPKALDMIASLYKEMIARHRAVTPIVMGDSAGGGLALALAQRMKSEHIAQPSKIILLSPWLDVTMRNPEIENIDRLDPFLSIAGLRKAGSTYADSFDPTNYLISPINGPLDELGEISLFIGSRDILAADARKFNKRAKANGISINYREYQEMVHGWMLLNFPESKQAQREIMDLIRSGSKR
jgi:acetyl esterase/lipase